MDEKRSNAYEEAAERPTYSRELIERYRAQDLSRELTTERVPFDLNEDEVTLSWGQSFDNGLCGSDSSSYSGDALP